MDDISVDSLMKRLQTPNKYQFLLNSINQSKIKVSKQVYNLQTRNIKKFIKQQDEMKQKQKQKHQKTQVKQRPKQTKHYDQNQLLQMQYSLKRQIAQKVFIQKATQRSSLSNHSQQSRSLIYSKSKKTPSLLFSNKQTSKISHSKSPSICQSIKQKKQQLNIPPLLRQKSYTNQDIATGVIEKLRQSSQRKRQNNIPHMQIKPKKSTSIIKQEDYLTRNRTNQSLLSRLLRPKQKIIQITDDKMMRYIKSLKCLVKKGIQQSISQQQINQEILRRYRSSMLPLTDTNLSQTKSFHLPFMQFISLSQTRKSIHRIINMSILMIQKVIFNLIDINQNGIIDQKDILHLIQISQIIPQAKIDCLKLLKASKDQRSIRNTQNDDTFSNRRHNNSSVDRILNKSNLRVTQSLQKSLNHSTQSISNFQDSRRINFNNKTHQSGCFSAQKFFSFKKTRTSFHPTSPIHSQTKISISFNDFQKIFYNQRPSLFYDLLKFLFKIKKQDLIPEFSKYWIQPKEIVKIVRRMKQTGQGFRNYNINNIIKNMEDNFHSDIQISKYKELIHVQQIPKS